MRTILTWTIALLNTVGFAAYLVWLAGRSQRILYTQDGVLVLLPCLAFLFVFACLWHGRHGPQGPEEEE